ncbi:MAG TPA: MBL fold metallo-hydrolase [Caulobacteraceae bacterium]|nr:MBL fold metallo-hydrolase [Caulobacteraceae bacterium]
MTRYRIAPGVQARTESTSDWCARHLREHLPRLVEAIRGGEARSAADLAGLFPGSVLGAAFAEAARSGSPWALPRDVVLPPSPFPLAAEFTGSGRQVRFGLKDPAAWAALAGLFLGPEAGRPPQAEAFARALVEAGHIEPADAPADRPRRAPGVYRLQHACALVVGAEAQLLVDPVHFIDGGDPIRPQDIGPVDAILLTHAHSDHVCPLSLAHYPRRTPILIYPSLGGSLLGVELDTILEAAGFTGVRVMECGQSVVFGDLTVTARRYFGEQPWLAHPPPDPRLRACGLTWIVEAGGRRFWFVADGGGEHGGSMLDEANEVRDTVGRIDLIAANLREFRWSPRQIDGSGRALLCYPTGLLFDPSAWPHDRLMTLGLRGAVELARRAGARFVAPYAHWFHAPGASVGLDDGRTEEQLLAEFDAIGQGAVEAAGWRIGDALTIGADGSLMLHRGAFGQRR